MKKTCDNCKAYVAGCQLGYKVKILDKNIMGYPIKNQVPAEECEKPKNIKALVECVTSLLIKNAKRN